MIGTLIRTERRIQDLSQTELANKASVSMQFLSRIERGESMPREGKLKDILKALDCELIIKRVVDESDNG